MVDHFESTLLMIMQIDSHNQLQPVSLTMNTPAEINAVINSHSTYGKVNTLKLCTSELRNQSQSNQIIVINLTIVIHIQVKVTFFFPFS